MTNNNFFQVEEELLLKRSITSDDRTGGFGGFGGSGGVEITDDEAGTLIGGGSGSNSSRKSWTNARRYVLKWSNVENFSHEIIQ